MEKFAIAADDGIQIALKAAIECLNPPPSIAAYEECMKRVWDEIEKVDKMLGGVTLHDSEALKIVESDLQWKRIMFSSLPIGVSQEQLRGVLALVKSRPFLADLDSISACSR
jgi:hypothetical protein